MAKDSSRVVASREDLVRIKVGACGLTSALMIDLNQILDTR